MRRLEEAGAELEERAAALVGELDETRRRVEELRGAIAAGEQHLDADIRELDALRDAVMTTGEAVAALRARTDGLEATIKEARTALDAIRAVVSELDVARATAQADLSHLAHTCEDAVTRRWTKCSSRSISWSVMARPRRMRRSCLRTNRMRTQRSG